MTIITPPQAAQIANVHEDTVRRWLLNPQREARIKFTVTPGGRYVIDKESFMSYLAAPVIIAKHDWAIKKPASKQTHDAEMSEAIAKRAEAQAAKLARIASMAR